MAQIATLSFGTVPPPAQQSRAFVPNIRPIQQVAIQVQHPYRFFLHDAVDAEVVVVKAAADRALAGPVACHSQMPCVAQEPPK